MKQNTDKSEETKRQFNKVLESSTFSDGQDHEAEDQQGKGRLQQCVHAIVCFCELWKNDRFKRKPFKIIILHTLTSQSVTRVLMLGISGVTVDMLGI